MSTRVKVKPRGPLLVEGDFTVLDEEGRAVDLGGATRVALCRCGASSCKPFCDGSHHKIRFGVSEAPKEP